MLLIVPGRASEVDPVRRLVAEVVPRHGVVQRPPGGHEREALQLVDLEGDATERAAGVDRELAVADECFAVAEALPAAEDVRATRLRVGCGRAQHDVPCVAYRGDEREVLCGVFRLRSVNWMS